MIVGIDPGAKGAIAYVYDNGLLLTVVDMPMAGKVLSPSQFKTLVLPDWAADDIQAVYLEKVGAMPGQGGTSMFHFGEKWGGPRVAFGMFYPVDDVTPTTWKRAVGISPAPKNLSAAAKKRNQEDQALELCRSWWPNDVDYFKLRKHAGRAEACCIAEYGRRRRVELGLPA